MNEDDGNESSVESSIAFFVGGPVIYSYRKHLVALKVHVKEFVLLTYLCR